ncbi:uncharacterized protein ACA1_252560 [Acanthamoeba castellanii str. Neff]|uniref:Uncharacterized protein n=1 Tax=Acanthamoeba castellanii (strain ATCC 30010 / Neff) TaxID=1257118 RepID=L8HD34_ACACF|nr:uncharacterized protein ACA1_252560 [Acanthamoeba castellanii str. Neff]ELR22311.1 hypothetical protein ACA1_252560 [Acanthamoeba castellanii str. Neff]
MLLWEALLVGAVFGGLLLFISFRSPSSAQAIKRGPTPPPALKPPGTPGPSERRKSVTFVRHCTPPSQRRQRQEVQEALVQRNIDLWERTDLAERLRLAEQEEGARREAEARHRSSAAEETKRIIDAILRSPICAASAERERWEESGQARRRRSSVDSVARSVVPKRAWRTRSDEVHQHHQPHQQHQQQRHHRQQARGGEGDGEVEGDKEDKEDEMARRPTCWRTSRRHSSASRRRSTASRRSCARSKRRTCRWKPSSARKAITKAKATLMVRLLMRTMNTRVEKKQKKNTKSERSTSETAGGEEKTTMAIATSGTMRRWKRRCAQWRTRSR